MMAALSRWVRQGAAAACLTASLGACATAERPAASAPWPERIRRVAEATERGGDPATATELLRAAVRADPADAGARLALGRQLLRAGDGAEAARLFAEAEALVPEDLEARVGAAQAALLLRDDGAAVAILTAVLARAPRHTGALIAMGVALDRRGEHEAAQRQYRLALAVDPGSRAARNNLGLSLALSGQAGSAVSMLEPLRDVADPRAPRYRQNLALALAIAGRVPEAEALLARDLGQDAARGDADLLAELGRAAFLPDR